MPPRPGLRTLIAAVILAALIASALGASYYYASNAAARPTPRVTWAISPLPITFSSQTGTGSAADSFTCSPPVSPVTLLAMTNQPDIITLTATPATFTSCGSTPDNVLLTAACTPTAQASNTCPGDYTGKVTVCGPTPYTCLQKTLTVVITVTNNNS